MVVGGVGFGEDGVLMGQPKSGFIGYKLPGEAVGLPDEGWPMVGVMVSAGVGYAEKGDMMLVS